MNKERRKALQSALDILDQMETLFEALHSITEEVRSDEEDALGNLPESLQEGERGQSMQEAIDQLDQVSMEEAFGEVREYIESAMA